MGLACVTRGADGRGRVLHPQEAGGGRIAGRDARVVAVDPVEVTLGREDAERRVRQGVEVHDAELQRGGRGPRDTRGGDRGLQGERLVRARVDRGVDDRRVDRGVRELVAVHRERTGSAVAR